MGEFKIAAKWDVVREYLEDVKYGLEDSLQDVEDEIAAAEDEIARILETHDRLAEERARVKRLQEERAVVVEALDVLKTSFAALQAKKPKKNTPAKKKAVPKAIKKGAGKVLVGLLQANGKGLTPTQVANMVYSRSLPKETRYNRAYMALQYAVKTGKARKTHNAAGRVVYTASVSEASAK